jgi:cytoskeleton-associated protein 5
MYAEEVDVIPKFPSGWEANLKSSKWKERKEALDEMLTVLQASLRIKEDAGLGDLCKSLAAMVQKDANIMCVIAAANCLEALGKGLGDPFGRYREGVIPPLLARLKERKANVTDAIGQALDVMFQAVGLLLSNKIPRCQLMLMYLEDFFVRYHP